MTLYSSGNGGSLYRSPTDITALHQQSLNQELVLGANPWLADDPETLVRLAQSGADPEELVHNAGALAGMESIDRLQTSLGRMNGVAARSVYGKLTEQQQRALNQMGYTSPNEGGGFLDNTLLEGAWDLTADVVGTVMKPVGSVVTPVAGWAFDALMWMGDVPAHFYRAIRQMEGWQQWLALGAAAGAVALTGGLALAGGAGLLGAGATGLLSGAASMGTLATAGTLGATALGAGVLSTIPTAIQNPTEWWDVMNPFSASGVGPQRGEKVFTAGGQHKARTILGNAAHLDAMARDIAAELDIEDLVFDLAGERDATKQNVLMASMEKAARKLADPGTQEYQVVFDGLTKLAMQPEFLEALDTLQSSKISFGRDIASMFGMEAGDFGHGIVSGGADALWLLAMDPTMALGKIGKLQRMTRRGLDAPSGPDAIQTLTRMVNEDKAVGATVAQVTKAIQNENFSEMPRAWRGLYESLIEFKTGEYLQHGLPALEKFDEQSFLKFIELGDGLKRITEGKATIRGLEQIVISTHNSSQGWGKFVNELKNAKFGLTDVTLEDDLRRTAKRFSAEADLERTLPTNYLEQSVDAGFVVRGLEEVPINQTWGYQSGKAIGNGLLYVPGGRSLGNFITGITTMTPPGSAIALTGEEAADHIPRFIETMGTHFNMPSAYRREWLDTVMRQGTVGQRRQALVSYMDSVLTAGGMRNTDELSGFADEFIKKYKQAYGYGGLDHVRVGNLDRIAGLLPDHHNAVYMVMPNLREMSKIVRQGHIVKNVARVVDHNFFEQAMSRAIKPGWLLRIGFIPRAAGEEMLAFWLRMSEGGLVQEFAGRTVGKRNAHRKAYNRLHNELGGDLEKLTRDELRALKSSEWLPGHMRPLVAMRDRWGWADPDTGILSDWIDLTTRLREQGLGLRSSMPKWMNDPNDWRGALLTGKNGSIRQMILQGTDPDYVRAGELWMNRHADSIMRATSSLNSGMMEKAIVNPDSTMMMVPDGKGGREEALVVMTGERGRVSQGDWRYQAAVHHRVQEVFHDDVVGPIYAEALTSYFPGFDEIELRNVAEALESLQLADSYNSKMLVGEFLQPRLDNWNATATSIGRHQPALGEAMRIAASNANGQVPSVRDFISTLEESIARLKIEGLADQAAVLDKLAARLDAMHPVLDGMNALGPDARAWTSAVLSRQMASDHTAYDMGAVWRQASGESFQNAPETVYYRGVRDLTHVRINDDGSLTFLGTGQEQWKHHGATSVSMSTSPEQSMGYSTTRSQANNRLDSGAMFEIDGTWLQSRFNTSTEQIRNAPSNFSNTEFTGDGLYMIGGNDGYEYTEVVVGLDTARHGNAEITIPAGHWRVQNSDDLRYVSEAAEHPKFRDVAGNVVYDIKGQPIEEIFPKTDGLIDEFIASLNTEERQWVELLYAEQMDEWKAWQGVRLEDTPPPRPESLFDFEQMPSGAGDFQDRVVMKWRALVDRKVQGNATVEDVLRAVDRDQRAGEAAFGSFVNPYAVDDMLRERLGLELLQNVDTFRPKNVLDNLWDRSPGNQLLIQGFDVRGQGGWASMEEMHGWAPFTTDFDSFQRKLVSQIGSTLMRPENTIHIKRSDRILAGKNGEKVARPVTDGEARVWTPVVPQESSHIDELLDGIDLDFADDFDLSMYRAVESGLARGSQVGPTQRNAMGNVSYTGDEQAARNAYWLIQGELEKAADGLISTERANAARRLEHQLTYEQEVGVWGTQPGFQRAWDDWTATLSTQPALEDKARRLLSQRRGWHYDDSFIRNMTEEEKIDILTRALRTYDASRAKYGQQVSVAMAEMAFDDPRIAKWLSSLFAANGEQTARVGMASVPRLALGGDISGKFGVDLAAEYAGNTGRRWNLDERYYSRVQPVEAEQFQVFSNNEVVPGISQQEALGQWAEDIVQSTLLNHRRGVREAQVYNPRGETGGVARRVNDKYEPLNPGERMDGPEDLWAIDAEGNVGDALEFGDNRYFDHVITEQSDELMLAALGPMLRDVFESDAGLTRVIANNFHEGGKFWGKRKAIDIEQDVDQFINMRRSRVSDLADEPALALPNVAITEKYSPLPNTVWDRIVRYGFDKVIGPSIDALARKPMSFHYFAAAYKQQMRNFSWMLSDELFDIQIPQAFGELIELGRAAGHLDDATMADARVVARAFGTDLAGASSDDVKRYLQTIGRDQGEFEEALAVAIAGRRNRLSIKVNNAIPEEYFDEAAELKLLGGDTDYEFVQAADRLRRNVNRNALSLTIHDDVVGARTDAERLVQAYNDAVPDAVWNDGKDAVLGYLEKYTTGLAHNLSNEQFNVLRAARKNLRYITETAEDTAALRAMENVIPFLDSHEQRSMFAEYGRNFLPFWYAEENFIKRWARTLSLGQFGLPGVKFTVPSGGLDVMRKAQLTYMGIKSAGIIRTDANGHDWVVYPGSGLLTEAVAKILPGELQPVGVLFQADTTSLLPGVTPDGNIGPSPFVAMPVHFVTHLFPDAKGVKQAILGDIGYNRGIIDQFVPTGLSRMWDALFMNEDSSVRYTSAMNAAIAYAEASGQGLQEGASAAEIDEYLDRMKNHARIIMVSQALAGYVVPGSPNALVTGRDGLLDDNALMGMNIEDPREVTSGLYRSFIENLGMDDGTAAFLEAHPHADLEDIVNPMAFTTSASQAPSGAPLPATEHGMKWYDSNRRWVDQSPEAGAWLIPQPLKDSDEGFNRTAYSMQVTSGLRKRRSPQQYIEAIKYRQGADVYFRNKDRYDEAVLSTGGNAQAKAQLDQKWAIWKGQFLAANPLFAEQIQSGDARIRRGRTIEQMRYAVTDPQSPDSPYKEPIAQLSRSYDSYAAQRKILGNRNDAESRGKMRQLKEQFANWGTAWTLRNPDIGRLWESVYRVEAGLA